MTIETQRAGSSLQVTVVGRLDTTTAPRLESKLNDELEGVTSLTLDFDALEYISSAGLRVILSTQKRMRKQGQMVVRHANEDVMDVFAVTGLVDVLTIEDSAAPAAE